jgi:hypothetical protein
MQKNTEHHDELVEEVLERLAKNELVISHERFICAKKEEECLDYIIIPDGIQMAEDTMEAIQDSQTLQSLKDIQSFLGFANFDGQLIF